LLGTSGSALSRRTDGDRAFLAGDLLLGRPPVGCDFDFFLLSLLEIGFFLLFAD
jgi:hypothetical protein